MLKCFLFLFLTACQTFSAKDDSLILLKGKLILQVKEKKKSLPIDLYIHTLEPKIRMDVMGVFGSVLLTYIWSPSDQMLIFPNQKKFIKAKNFSLTHKQLKSSDQKIVLEVLNQSACLYQLLLERIDTKLVSQTSKQNKHLSLKRKKQTHCKLQIVDSSKKLLAKSFSLKILFTYQSQKFIFSLNRNDHLHLSKADSLFHILIPSSFQQINSFSIDF